MGDDSNLHFASHSQAFFFEILVTGHKKEAGMGDAGTFLVLYITALIIMAKERGGWEAATCV